MASDPQIDRINEISQLARTAWFSLLGYLVFVGITLLGVEDADFFVPSRQTQLPLVNVSIPTASFFWAAPILGAALYTYLHLFLLKLWDAHAEARTTDADATHHWLVGDFVLIWQRDPTTRRRPLAWLTNLITVVLVWWSGPIVLGYAWWRSMPAHSEQLTLVIAACFGLTLLVGATSWWSANARLRQPWKAPWQTWWHIPAAIGLGLLLVATSWLRTEGGAEYVTAKAIDLVNTTVATHFRETCQIPGGDGEPETGHGTLACVTAISWVPKTDWFTFGEEHWFFGRWLKDDNSFTQNDWNPLASTDLSGVDLVPLPPDWRNFQTARRGFREAWCRREGLDMTICDHHSDGDRPSPPHVATARAAYCQANGIEAGDPCQTAFASLDTRFDREWLQERASLRASLPSLDLSRKDLRRMSAPRALLVRADLSEAQMEGAVLREAQMEGADLIGAQMEGADLSRAQMEGADLSWAQMEGADLSWAQMEGADLSRAQMEGADLGWAQMEGANLRGAQMEGADLGWAQMEGANLSWAQMEGADLSEAQMEGAVLREAQMEGAYLSWAQMEGADLSWAQMEGAVLWRAQMEGAVLIGAQMEGADLIGAQMEGAVLIGAQMEGALLIGAQMEGAVLREAQMDGAVLWRAQMEGADLREAQLRSAKWEGARTGSPAHFADLRGAQSLTQDQLDHMIGNAMTLLPDAPAPDTGKPYTLPSCWTKPPAFFDAMIKRMAAWSRDPRSSEDKLRAGFLCSPGKEPQPTGIRLSLDAPYPEGHPLAEN